MVCAHNGYVYRNDWGCERKSVAAKRTQPKSGWHISTEDIAALIDHKISAVSCRAMIVHIVHCEKCRNIVSEVTLSRLMVADPGEL